MKMIKSTKPLKMIEETREYHFTQKDFKESLGIEGDITNFELYEGLSLKEEENNISSDKNVWIIKTIGRIFNK